MDTLHTEPLDTARRSSAGLSRALRRRPAQVLAGALAVIVVAALILSVVEWRHYESQANRLDAVNRLESSALAAADTYGVDVGSYNYANLHGPSAPWTQIEDHATAAFRAKYEQTTGLLQSTVVAYKGTAKATVETAAVASIKGTQAVVLIELDQTITNSTQKSGPQSETFLVTMTLQRQGAQWLISAIGATV